MFETWAVMAGLPLRALVTTRAGGTSRGRYASLNLGGHVGDDPLAVLSNRRLLASALGLGWDRLVMADQLHGVGATWVDDAEGGRGALSCADTVTTTDILLTRTPGLALTMLVADCAPIVLYAPDIGAIAVIHAGWRGTVAGAARVAVEALAAAGGDPADMRAGIGPCIGADQFEVGSDVALAAGDYFGASVADVLEPVGTHRWRFDLAGANSITLVESGLRQGNIEAMVATTGPATPFFSHRAEGPCGRFALVAILERGGPQKVPPVPGAAV